jgi:4-carboxymuconolactone decarboxylase
MARIAGVSTRDAGLRVRLAYYFTRRQIARLAGRETERMIEPVQVYAHLPGVLSAYGRLEQATAKLDRLEDRFKALAELKAATLTNCEYCIDLGSQIARRWGLSDGQLLALPRYRESDLFDAAEKLVLDYAVGMSRTPVEVSDELFAELREHFDEAQLVELTHLIALENLRGRFNLALGVGAAGFSEGMVCAAPASVAQPTDGPPVTLINVFEVPAEHVDAFVANWRHRAELLSAKPGFLGTRLHRALSPGARFQLVNVALWESREAFRAATADPGFQARTVAATADARAPVSANPDLYRVVAEYGVA